MYCEVIMWVVLKYQQFRPQLIRLFVFQTMLLKMWKMQFRGKSVLFRLLLLLQSAQRLKILKNRNNPDLRVVLVF